MELGWFPLLMVSIALGCDAFSVALGVAGPFRGQNFRIAFHFGLFQGLLPLIGWAIGATVAKWIDQWDHWIAFGLLAAVGGHMLWEAFGAHDEERTTVDRSRKWSLIVLSVAVSIDAMAVGLALGVQKISPWVPCLLIGLTTGAMSLVALHLGRRLKAKFGKPAEILGGVVLIILAIKFLVDL